MELSNDGIRNLNINLDEIPVKELRKQWENHIEQIDSYPNSFNGRGIVICAGGLRYFTCAWVNINILRMNNCKLPIEIWYTDNELTEELVIELNKLNVKCKNFKNYSILDLQGYSLKPFAILNSEFKEILFLDADNNCVNDPTYLFETKEYQDYGVLFWPDYWKTSKKNPIWKIVNNKNYHIMEQESGQILINKEKCWKELNLCMYFNRNSKYYYQLLHGDKDTFKFAWIALQSPYYMIKYDVGSCGFYDEQNKFHGITMVQYDTNGTIIFLHRNFLKWDLTGNYEVVWKKIKRFKDDAKVKKFEINYYKENGYPSLDISGDIEVFNFIDLFENYELNCLNILRTLRKSDFYYHFLLYIYFYIGRGNTNPFLL